MSNIYYTDSIIILDKGLNNLQYLHILYSTILHICFPIFRSEITMQQKERNINSFWVAYGDAVVDSGIPEAMAKWYVRCARKFALSIKGKPLPER